MEYYGLRKKLCIKNSLKYSKKKSNRVERCHKKIPQIASDESLDVLNYITQDNYGGTDHNANKSNYCNNTPVGI